MGGSTGSDLANDPALRSLLLSTAIPATSFAVGSNALVRLEEREIGANMDLQANVNGWPSEDDYPSHRTWFHSDLKDVAYLYVQEAFNAIVRSGNLGISR